MKNVAGSILFVTVLIIIVCGTTIAWFTWTNTKNNKNFVNFDIIGVDNNCIKYQLSRTGNEKIKSTTDKTKGYITSITISQNCLTTDIYMDLKLKLVALPNYLQNKSFKYDLVKDGISISSGNFENKKQSNAIILSSKEEISSISTTYTLYLWYEGNYIDDIKKYNFNLVGEIVE